ncbi:Hsp20/alpha crystallin family protein [Halococcoides cellulosivorans]|uniref:Molecular chaperone Hsp20 n=1 Tax=Halococcoides cellulosivorans TaxID=1679096 RepID=A0A2R4X209_9EURY|nr:Hsp20/alpha crystallin family protein [Halococcoides cellulosivorans]AWB27837.1 molecular chaperone Hsp20 [Halococcoides cellulosivorans]
MTALEDGLAELPDSVFADLLESEEAYCLRIDVPGATPDSTTVTAGDGRLSIEAHRQKDPPAEYSYVEERRQMILDVELPLPPIVDSDEATASVERGVLEVTLPKRHTGGVEIPIES